MHITGKDKWLVRYATFFIMAFGIYYMPIDGRVGFGSLKLALMSSMFIVCFSIALHCSKAMLLAGL